VGPDTHADGDGLVLVAEQVRELGGTERIVQAVADRYPRATLVAADFTTTNLPEGHRNPLLPRARLVPVGRTRRHYLLPLYARRLARAGLDDAVLVLSFVHTGWSAGVRLPPHARHVAYTAGLPKALYADSAVYLRDYAAPLRPVARAALPLLRAQNARLLRVAHRLLTNSQASARALRQVLGLQGEVLHPPVRTTWFTPDRDAPRRHFLLVARLVGHKRADVAVRAFAGLRERLVVVGGGGELERLRAAAPPNVRFAGFVGDEELRELYRTSHALICPSVEEFGIVMAEAHACGTPVIAPRSGGALEIVRPGLTGVLLPQVTPATLAGAVRGFGRTCFDPDTCRAAVLRFDESCFLDALDRVLRDEWVLVNGREPAPQPVRAAAPARAGVASPAASTTAHSRAPARLSSAARP
jgi:glycosyltransferase involved in cell wall biosynthesis